MRRRLKPELWHINWKPLKKNNVKRSQERNRPHHVACRISIVMRDREIEEKKKGNGKIREIQRAQRHRGGKQTCFECQPLPSGLEELVVCIVSDMTQQVFSG